MPGTDAAPAATTHAPATTDPSVAPAGATSADPAAGTTPDLSVDHDGPTTPQANPTVTAATLVTATVVATAVAAVAEALAEAPPVAPATTPMPRQRLRGRRRPAPAPIPLGSLTQREHRPDTCCASCGSSSVTSLSMTLADGTPARFASCRTCGHRTWQSEDGVLSVGEVLTRSTRDPR